MSFRFEHTVLLHLLWLLPILLLVQIYLGYWAKKNRNKFASYAALRRLAPEADRSKSWIKFSLRLLALAALIFAAANPQQGGKVENQKVSGAQIVFALDVSRSMLVEDVPPNRLLRAQQLIKRMVPSLKYDQVGLIGFAGKAFPLVPLTPDKSSLLMQLRNAHPDAISAQGTNFSSMISLAATFYNESLPSDRILVVIGDGEDHDHSWKEKIDQLRAMDVRIFTIGVGTERGGLIPERRKSGTIEGYVKDETGSAVVSTLVETSLKELADFGDGDYHYLKSLQGGEQFLRDVLAGVGRSEFERKIFTTYESQYQWPLTVGLLLLFIEWLLFEKRTGWIQRLRNIKDAHNPSMNDEK
ncbi:MAG: VWA domain-containing protein [Cryomorphaceae bacterium]|nr:VWA domain-containing protein [Cryomorphaceae bacterium]